MYLDSDEPSWQKGIIAVIGFRAGPSKVQRLVVVRMKAEAWMEL